MDMRISRHIEVDEDDNDTMACVANKSAASGNDTDDKADELSSRDIFIFDRLESELALPVIKRLLKLNRRDPITPINLYINSSGGNGYNADAIIATMYSITAPVNTICLGHALSGACEVLAAGTGLRSAYEFATMMIHQTLWETDGDITNLEIQAAQGLRFREAQIQLLHRCTGQTKEQIRKDIDRDFYLSARDALGYGLVDKIIHHTGNRVKSTTTQSNIVSEIGSNRTVSGARFTAPTPLNNISIAQPGESKSVARPALVREAKSKRRSRRSYKK
jgi:ATP-dependent Clp protease, protease subunit